MAGGGVTGNAAAKVIRNAFGEHALERFIYGAAVEAGETTRFDAQVLHALDRHGFVVMENAVPAAECDRLVAEMRPYIDATPHGLHGLGGTRRVGALIARSPASHGLIAHPGILRLVGSVLGEQRLSGDAVRIGNRTGKGEKGFRYPWQLHLTQIIDVGPGGGTDAMPHSLKMHRANGMWMHNFEDAGLDLQVEVMWALSPFTKENGATHVVLGSHRDQPRGAPGRTANRPSPRLPAPPGAALAGILAEVDWAPAASRRPELRRGVSGLHGSTPQRWGNCRYFLTRQRSGMLPRLKAPADSVLKEDFDVLVPRRPRPRHAPRHRWPRLCASGLACLQVIELGRELGLVPSHRR